MTRVLIIEPSGNLWGSERALLDIVGWLPDVEVAVCCPPDTPLIAELKKLSIRTLPYFVADLHKKSRWQRVLAAIGVARACLGFRPTVIHLNQGGCYRVALPAAILFNLSILAHVRIFEDIAYFAERRPNSRRLRGLIAISAAVEKELREHLPFLSIHLFYDAYAANTPPVEPTSREGNSNRIGCIGRVVPIKGQELLIGAVHWLWGHGDSGIECLIVGDGPAEYVEHLKALAANGAGASAIKWLGVRDDVGSLLRTCGVLVCASQKEPLGRVIFEAWDAGAIPVASATSGGASEIINAAEGGILYTQQTPESLAKAILVALRLRREEAAELIENGRAWIAENCEPKRYGEAFAKLLTSASAPVASSQ